MGGCREDGSILSISHLTNHPVHTNSWLGNKTDMAMLFSPNRTGGGELMDGFMDLDDEEDAGPDAPLGAVRGPSKIPPGAVRPASRKDGKSISAPSFSAVLQASASWRRKGEKVNAPCVENFETGKGNGLLSRSVQWCKKCWIEPSLSIYRYRADLFY